MKKSLTLLVVAIVSLVAIVGVRVEAHNIQKKAQERLIPPSSVEMSFFEDGSYMVVEHNAVVGVK
jgi:hypothetical protein